MEGTPNRVRNRGLTIATDGLETPRKLESNNRARVHGITLANNDGSCTPGASGATNFFNAGNGVGENVHNGNKGGNVFEGTNGTSGANSATYMNDLTKRLLGTALTPTTSSFGANGLAANSFGMNCSGTNGLVGNGLPGLSPGLQQPLSAFQQSHPNIHTGLTPDSPIALSVSFAQILDMSMELGRNQHEIQHLKTRVQEYEEKEKKEKGSAVKVGRQGSVFSTPSSKSAGNPATMRTSRSGSVLNSNVRAVALQSQRSGEGNVSHSPTPHRAPTGPAKLNSGSTRSGRGRHNRNNTPEQIIARGELAGTPIYTMGMAPQDIRGLVNDFVDEMKSWAFKWTSLGDLSSEDLAALSTHSAIVLFLGNASAIYPLVADRFWRVALVAALVSRDIVYNAVSDHFLFNSQHADAPKCDTVYERYEKLNSADKAAKHRILHEQKALYTKIKEEPGHRKWRTDTAKIFAEMLIDKLKGLVIENDVTDADRDHALHELYIKGYRIGFRLRMEPMKWQMSWPSTGNDFDVEKMVNESRNLCGDTLHTIRMVTENPQGFSVRFATSPTIRSFDFSSGSEHETVVHKALVHLSRKLLHIGAERGYGLSSSPTK